MAWTYWIFVVLTLALTGFIGYGTFATARLLRTWTPDRNLLLLPEENVVRIGLILACIGLGALSGLPADRLGWIRVSAADAAWGGGAGLGAALFFLVSTRLVIRVSGHRYYSTLLLDYLVPHSRREFLLLLVALVPVVLVEELLFRSLLLGGLSPLFAADGLVIVLGILFGLLHSPQGLWGMVGAMLAGILFGLLFLWSGSLLPPLLAHYVANAVQIGVAYAQRLPQRRERIETALPSAPRD